MLVKVKNTFTTAWNDFFKRSLLNSLAVGPTTRMYISSNYILEHTKYTNYLDVDTSSTFSGIMAFTIVLFLNPHLCS